MTVHILIQETCNLLAILREKYSPEEIAHNRDLPELVCFRSKHQIWPETREWGQLRHILVLQAIIMQSVNDELLRLSQRISLSNEIYSLAELIERQTIHG